MFVTVNYLALGIFVYDLVHHFSSFYFGLSCKFDYFCRGQNKV